MGIPEMPVQYNIDKYFQQEFSDNAEDFIAKLLGHPSLGLTTNNLFNPKLSIALATMPIFSGSWGLTKTIEGLIIFTIKILDHEITYK